MLNSPKVQHSLHYNLQLWSPHVKNCVWTSTHAQGFVGWWSLEEPMLLRPLCSNSMLVVIYLQCWAISFNNLHEGLQTDHQQEKIRKYGVTSRFNRAETSTLYRHFLLVNTCLWKSWDGYYCEWTHPEIAAFHLGDHQVYHAAHMWRDRWFCRISENRIHPRCHNFL